MAAATKPLELARPFRTGFYFGLGLLAAWLILGIVAWVASLVLGIGLLGAAALGLAGETGEGTSTEAQPAIERRAGN